MEIKDTKNNPALSYYISDKVDENKKPSLIPLKRNR